MTTPPLDGSSDNRTVPIEPVFSFDIAACSAIDSLNDIPHIGSYVSEWLLIRLGVVVGAPATRNLGDEVRAKDLLDKATQNARLALTLN